MLIAFITAALLAAASIRADRQSQLRQRVYANLTR